jgi:hypothetical protein
MAFSIAVYRVRHVPAWRRRLMSTAAPAVANVGRIGIA